MNIIIGCEESQAVCKEFRKRGFNAYSCDLKWCSGGRPDWHLKMSLFDAIKGGSLVTQDGQAIYIDKWTLGIFHPPCTHLCVSGNRSMGGKMKDGRTADAIKFFIQVANFPISHSCIENPIGIMSSIYGKPTQIIQPYFFGEKKQKSTCLWLKNLPPLFHAKETDLFTTEITHVDRGKMMTFSSGKVMPAWYGSLSAGSDRGTTRSVTFKGIAEAMASQWSDYLNHKYKV